MGGKRKGKQNQDDDFPEAAVGNQKNYISEASKAKAELREAKQRELLNQDDFDNDAADQSKKKQRKKKNQAVEDDDAFGGTPEQSEGAAGNNKKKKGKKELEEEK